MTDIDAAAGSGRLEWREVVGVFKRPQPFTWAMAALFAIIPLYLFLPAFFDGRTLHAPAVWLDDAIALRPEWALVYGSLFCAALLPAFVVHHQELLHRTVLAYLAAWLVSLAFFLAYPTLAPAHPKIVVHDFADWALRTIYASDVKYNCFPSLHVAQSFLAAFACREVHRGVGRFAIGWASLVGVSTLFTKQHYFLDVVAGALLGYIAYAAFIRGFRRESIPPVVRRAAPALAAGAFATYGLLLLVFLVLYAVGA